MKSAQVGMSSRPAIAYTLYGILVHAAIKQLFVLLIQLCISCVRSQVVNNITGMKIDHV